MTLKINVLFFIQLLVSTSFKFFPIHFQLKMVALDRPIRDGVSVSLFFLNCLSDTFFCYTKVNSIYLFTGF